MSSHILHGKEYAQTVFAYIDFQVLHYQDSALQQAGRVDVFKLANAEEQVTLLPKACKRLGSHFLLSERALMHIMLPGEHLERLKPEDTDNACGETESQFRRREE